MNRIPFTRSLALIRNDQAHHLADLFLMHAIGAVIVIRVFLTFTGFPQLGGHGLHIAHMLWGGMFMLVALFLQFFFLDQAVRYLAAAVGGIGFGTFIDELGKFITADHNYFFRPTFALVYIIFLILFFAIRFVVKRPLSRNEHFANALELLASGCERGLSRQEQAEFAAHVAQVDAPDDLKRELNGFADALQIRQTKSPGLYARVKGGTAHIVERIITARWFHVGLVLFFIARALNSVMFWLLFVLLDDDPTSSIGEWGGIDYGGWVFMAATLVEWFCVGLGFLHLLSRSRAKWVWFRRAMIVSILFTQFAVFYYDQLNAVTGLIVNLLLYNALSHF